MGSIPKNGWPINQPNQEASMTNEVRNLTDAEIDTVAGGFMLALTLLRACMSVAHAPTGSEGGGEDTAASDDGGDDNPNEDEGSDK
jgi:hypothetical protein